MEDAIQICRICGMGRGPPKIPEMRRSFWDLRNRGDPDPMSLNSEYQMFQNGNGKRIAELEPLKN